MSLPQFSRVLHQEKQETVRQRGAERLLAGEMEGALDPAAVFRKKQWLLQSSDSSLTSLKHVVLFLVEVQAELHNQNRSSGR